MTYWRNEIAAWWGDVRDWMAFGIAPLAVPLIVGLSVGFDAMIAIFSLMFSYFVTLLFGLPLYAFLRARVHQFLAGPHCWLGRWPCQDASGAFVA
jgi:hypothetical protein